MHFILKYLKNYVTASLCIVATTSHGEEMGDFDFRHTAPEGAYFLFIEVCFKLVSNAMICYNATHNEAVFLRL